jgi:hypothetical protein
MTDYKRKYLKYKEKYLTEKKSRIIQAGGEKKIIYSEEILDFVKKVVGTDDTNSLNNLKESIYSCIYINMTNMKGACEPSARTVKCSVLDSSVFPFFASDGFDYASYKFIDDQFNNNLILVFGSGSVFYCDHFTKELFIIFIDIYTKLQSEIKKKEYKFIHIVGHSMGASLANLFSYFIMIVEKSTIGKMHIPCLKYFSVKYDLTKTYDISSIQFFNETYLTTFGPNTTIDYDKDTNFEIIKTNLNELLNIDYPKIADKVSVCVVGAFPVLFKTTHRKQYDEYKSFYGNRCINFINCCTETETEPIAANINEDFCDDKPFNQILKSSDNVVLAELTSFEYVNINNLTFMNTNDSKYKLTFIFDNRVITKQVSSSNASQKNMSSKLHHYNNNYIKLKKFVEVNDE